MGITIHKTDPVLLIHNECWNTAEFSNAIEKLIIDDFVDGKSKEELFSDLYDLHMEPLKECISVANSPHSGIMGKLLKNSLSGLDVENRVWTIVYKHVPVILAKYNIPVNSFAKKEKKRRTIRWIRR